MDFYGVVEGITDEPVLKKIFRLAGVNPAHIYIAGGKSKILNKIQAYNNAGRHHPWVVLVDLDSPNECAPELLSRYINNFSPLFIMRIAVQAVESWLMADRSNFARFFSVPVHHIPDNPDLIISPKDFLVNLARMSRKKYIKQDMVPDAESGRRVGRAYPSRLIEFALDDANGWRPEIARRSSDSLTRCIQAIESLTRRRRGVL